MALPANPSRARNPAVVQVGAAPATAITATTIIAAAIAASATVDTDAITIDPEKLLRLAPGESAGPDQGQPPS